tara:strand:- start:3274 stop:5448 length:2175 start_codon:yes stop_codon:yes gene_type:complete
VDFSTEDYGRRIIYGRSGQSLFTSRFRLAVVAVLATLLLTGCGGGGGGIAAPQVSPGPVAPNGPVTPIPVLPTPSLPNEYAKAEQVIATITAVRINSAPLVDFTLVNSDGMGLTGLTHANVRFHIAKLVPGTDGDSSYWQSYVNRLAVPSVNPDKPTTIQATAERDGTLTDHGDGTYTYLFNTDIAQITTPLAVSFEPLLTHRVGIRFSGGPVSNPSYDWIPATQSRTGIAHRDIVANESCNSCHQTLAAHGGYYNDMQVCVLCHNPVSTEPNSGASLDFKVMIHKIHQGSDLPSVIHGEPYQVYGFGDRLIDFSEVIFPQDSRNCGTCHAGTATQSAKIHTSTLTQDGDNWAEVPSREACGACHDDLDFATHFGDQVDNSGCQSCHSATGLAGTVASDHFNERVEGASQFAINVHGITQTAPDEFPRIHFSLTNPQSGNAAIDITGSAISRLRAAIAWPTTDFTNSGSADANYNRTDAPSLAVPVGDGSYTLTSTTPIPTSATGSGMLIFEGRFNGINERIPLITTPTWFGITDTTAAPRRQVVSDEKCNSCHGLTSAHGENRANTRAGCQGCHNPRLASANQQSLDFKSMIHGIHASGVRQQPLLLDTTPYSTAVVQYPGNLSNCNACHVNDSYTLPLASGVLASTYDSGVDVGDYADDQMISATASVCSSCHDSEVAGIHMLQNGADFTATQSSSNSESCVICHGPGRVSDVSTVHGLAPE